RCRIKLALGCPFRSTAARGVRLWRVSASASACAHDKLHSFGKTKPPVARMERSGMREPVCYVVWLSRISLRSIRVTSKLVGWVERSETHARQHDGFRKELNPSYEPQVPACAGRTERF